MRGTLPSVGDAADGRYALRRELGRGAGGVVFEARERQTGRSVVVKLGAPDLSESRLPEWRARFAREARALAAVRHPGVVEILDTGDLDDGTPYIVMEHLEGRTLEGLLATRGKLSPLATVAMALQVSDALHAVHEAGIVHRDLKPNNIIVVRDRNGVENAKLIDFGMAQIPAEEKISGVGALIGTPAYMSPEQLLAEVDVDRRADIYALGVTMFECLTGCVPYAGPYGRVLLQACGDGPPPSLPSDIGCALAEVVQQAIAKARNDRFGSAMELSVALHRAAVGLGTVEGVGPPAAVAQRRRFARAPYNTPVEIVLTGGLVVDGRSEDISEGGLLVICWERCEAGANGRMRFALPIEGRVIRTDVHLRWARSADPRRDIGPRALGLEFVDPPQELSESIAKYVRLMGQREDR